MTNVDQFDLKRTRTTLFGALLDAKERYDRNKAILEDPTRQPLSYGNLVLGALVLGGKLAGFTAARERVGVVLPNMQGLAFVLFGLNAIGRVPALLNYTAGLKNLRAACTLAGLQTIITSRRFVEQGKLDDVITELGDGRRIVWVEDLRASVTSFEKVRALIQSWRARAAHARAGLAPDDPAIVLFTS